ncbi:hypothetical protein RSSM_00056 [Rhodopirellula sallentina SM41]|uniref:Uncharacterized protein n=1 Tax=Rhodopirellula sallentina SM41 TaxID=1263870 RepID=M5UB45_9BACT|nr:hypothetical protein RSSM_00056 [Rhodopirellula sallentina SM41]
MKNFFQTSFFCDSTHRTHDSMDGQTDSVTRDHGGRSTKLRTGNLRRTSRSVP